MTDRVRELLKERDCPPHIVEGGLEGLLENWEQIAQSVEAGYALGLDDYLNDMDVRQMIAETLPLAAPAQLAGLADRLDRADELMRSLVEPTESCLWGEEIAEEEGWTPHDNWWYFTRPRQADPDLLAEIEDATSLGD